MHRFIVSVLLLSLLLGSPVNAQDVVGAYKLYTQRQYAASADAFEKIVAKAPPEARLYYYTGLANREAKRYGRAKQLFDYVVTNFSTAPEAELARAAAGFIPADKSPGDKSDAVATSAVAQSPGETKPVSKLDLAHKKGDFVFTSEEIAKEGSHGVDQTNYPNCWFESSMSALADLPRGQKLLAKMITYGDKGEYLVRFPGDGKEYKITEAQLEGSGVNCKAKWASLLDYAERLKFPGNAGADGVYGDESRLETGLRCITGCHSEHLSPAQASDQELSSFIYGAVSSQNPITCGTYASFKGQPPIIPRHAYTIIGFDSSMGMVILRNPHGQKSRKFNVIGDPQHLHFEQQDDGVCRMRLDLFRSCFNIVCRSFI